MKETRPLGKSIRQRVITHQMPPAYRQTVGVHEFKNDMSLTDDQIATIVRWVDSGAPMGDPKDMPPPRQWPADNEWKGGERTGPAGSGHSSPIPTLWLLTIKMSGGGQSLTFLSPSPAGCVPSKVRPTTAAGRRV